MPPAAAIVSFRPVLELSTFIKDRKGRKSIYNAANADVGTLSPRIFWCGQGLIPFMHFYWCKIAGQRNWMWPWDLMPDYYYIESFGQMGKKLEAV